MKLLKLITKVDMEGHMQTFLNKSMYFELHKHSETEEECDVQLDDMVQLEKETQTQQ